MAKQIRKGDTVIVRATVSKVWGDGKVSMYLPGLDYPVTLHADDIEDVTPGPKEKPVGGRRKFFDKPT